MTYSVDFRKKVLKIKKEEKLSYREVSSRFCISRSAVVRWNKRLEGTNKRTKPWKKLNQKSLKRDIEEFPDSYSRERAERLGISPSGIRYAKKRLGITYKKNSESPQGRCRKKIYILPTDRQVKERRKSDSLH